MTNIGDERQHKPSAKHTLEEVRKSLEDLVRNEFAFTSVRLQAASNLTAAMSNLTFRRLLNYLGYKLLNTRRKGVLTPADLKQRRQWCRKISKRELDVSFWREGIAMYIDGVGFEWKLDPYAHAKTLGSREWRLRKEGLRFGCTAKGKSEGKKLVKFLVAMSYGAGVVLCEPLVKRMCGMYYAELVASTFPAALTCSGHSSQRVLQDGDPSQNSALSKKETNRLGLKIFSIPARSPDLNPIENLFNQVRMEIKKQSLQNVIQRESEAEFTSRVKQLLLSYDPERVDRLIDSMPRRIQEVLKVKGQRIKY